jgi:hypothetical protein
LWFVENVVRTYEARTIAMPRQSMPGLVFDAREGGDLEVYLVELNSALPRVWKNLLDNSAQGKRTYANVGCENTDGLLPDEEEDDEDAVLKWISDMCIEDNVWNPAPDGRVDIRNCVKITLQAD